MGVASERGGLRRFARYEERADFTSWDAMALASIVPPGEHFVLGIDCADRWLFTRWTTKLVLTDERVVAFSPDPAAPVKRSYWLRDITAIRYETKTFDAELRLLGASLYEGYTVPKRFGEEFADAVRARLNNA